MKSILYLNAVAIVIGSWSSCLAADLPKADVQTGPASPLGNTALTANGRIQPRGLPTKYWFEYGSTAEYGQQTAPVSLPPKLAAYYHETWDHGSAGWQGGMNGKDLVHHAQGGASGGFMRYSEPSGDDPNHTDGIGTLHLTSYFYPSTHPAGAGLQGWWGGGNVDLRDARVTMSVRGNNFVPNGAELVWWTQSDNDLTQQLTPNWRRANWAYTGFSLTDALASGKWETISYQLKNDSHQWTYGGNNLAQKRPNYAYDSINNSQSHVSCDFFHLLAFVNPQQRPTGTIDIDEFTIAYRNYSLITPNNVAKLSAYPHGGPTPPTTLTDGWRHGEGRSWISAPNPQEPLEFVYAFQRPVDIQTIQIHQNPEWPSKDIEIEIYHSERDKPVIIRKTLPKDAPGGPNFAFLLERGLELKGALITVTIRILSGYQSQHWGLGEIEIFGDGGFLHTDNDWYHVNLDLPDLKPGETYHYRLVAENDAGKVVGPDASFTIPAETKPHALTAAAIRIGNDTATLTGRLTPMGQKTQFYFEYGLDTNYGSKSPEQYGGLQITPRHAATQIKGLSPKTTYHYRLVGVNESGTTFGDDATFQTK